MKNFQEPQFQEDLIDNLVMDQERIKILKALASSYVRVNQQGNKIEHDAWTADFVKGKGSGLIFLLHGKPGVGKTVTAGKPLPQHRYLLHADTEQVSSATRSFRSQLTTLFS